MTLSPATIGTPSHDSVTVPNVMAPAASASEPDPEHERPTLADDRRVQAFAEVAGGRRRPDPLVERVREADCPRCLVVQDDGDRLDVEDLAYLLAHELDHGLEVELPGQGRADLVHHGQLRVALADLLGVRQPPGAPDRAIVRGAEVRHADPMA